MNFIEKEFHPIIEEYITGYMDEKLSSSERDAFEEVLASDEELRSLALSAKHGKKMMGLLRVLREINE